MVTSEKSFQSYFMKCLPHGYRTALTNGGGFPDCLLIHGDFHFLVELKTLKLGKRGDKVLRGLYTPTQMPWHLNYFLKGGKSLYTLFKLEDCYGLIREDEAYCRAVLDGLKYSGLKDFDYKEFKVLRHVIEELYGG